MAHGADLSHVERSALTPSSPSFLACLAAGFLVAGCGDARGGPEEEALGRVSLAAKHCPDGDCEVPEDPPEPEEPPPWEPDPAPPPPRCESACSASSSCAASNVCLDNDGRLMSCSTWGLCDRGACASYCGDFIVRSCSAACTAGGNVATTCGQMGFTCVGGVYDPPPACSTCTLASSCGQLCSNGAGASTCASFQCQPCTSCKWTSDPDQQCMNGAYLSTCGVSGRSTRPLGYVRVVLSSGSRRLVQGTDGGHESDFCGVKDTPAANCQVVSEFDGLQLRPDPSGAWSSSGTLPPLNAVSVRPIEGPYQKFHSDGKWEWKEGTTNDWTSRRYDLVDLTFKGVSGGASYGGTVTIHWDEDDGLNDDDFNWRAPIGQYLTYCLNQAPVRQWHTLLTGQVISNQAGRFLCDSRGCSHGEYEVRYDVKCYWDTY